MAAEGKKARARKSSKPRSRKDWVDFKAIKEAVTMQMVLGHYGITLKEKGESLVGTCPLHNGTNPSQFSVSAQKSIWHCFGDCARGGNVLDFVMLKEGVPLKEAGQRLIQWFNLKSPPLKEERKAPPAEKKPESRSKQVERPSTARSGPGSAENGINPTLPFQLRSLDPDHEYLKARDLSPETIKEFGLGFCSRGMMKGRIAIPIHNENGELVAYAGRTLEEPSEENPKYTLPPNFKKSHVLFNLHRTQEDHLVLVEGFFDVFRLHQAGFPDSVALMGSSMSSEQEALLLERMGPHGHLILMFDGDDAGRKCTEEVTKRLIQKVYVKEVALEENEQPDKLSKEEIEKLLG